MTREIKFRAWTGNEMEYQVLVGQLGTFYAYQDPDDRDCAISTKYPENIPVMQFTGLHSKSGQPIYEGDIVNEGFDSLYEIAMGYAGKDMDNEPECWVGAPIGKGNDNNVWGLSNNQAKDCEIIGNIYENPELLTNSN